MVVELDDVRVSVCCGAPATNDVRSRCSKCGEGTSFEVAPDGVQVNPMVEFSAAQKAVRAGYKRMDEALAQAVMDELGYAIPAVFSWTDSLTGDRWAINITARATLIERGQPQDAE